ncbi:MAG TPA: sigma-70 family RNA polymerase sigma factor [Pirellulales bacterium]|nr:sigma-70 family RNA polymerase sigma factor [Pirellulales bacterium]
MPRDQTKTDELVRRSAQGDAAAVEQLFAAFRPRLRRMVAVRIDARLAARVDPSDVVQDALVDASRKLHDYLKQRPLAFYPWLRQLTMERLIVLHRRHIKSKNRSLLREDPDNLLINDDSALELAARLSGGGSSPSRRLVRDELRTRVRDILSRLSPNDRQVLELRYLEDLSTVETAEVLAISESAVKMRHLRAMARVKELIKEGQV